MHTTCQMCPLQWTQSSFIIILIIQVSYNLGLIFVVLAIFPVSSQVREIGDIDKKVSNRARNTSSQN